MKHAFKNKSDIQNGLTHYCPGCDHNTLHEIVAEVLEELGDMPKAICVSPVGCANYAYNYINIDFCQSANKHATAVSVGIKKVRPAHLVFTYQDNSDLSGIDTGEIIHTANRGDNITIIFNNNGTYDLNAKQDDVTSRKPIKLSEIVAALEGPVYVARVAVNTPENKEKAKAAIKCAFSFQKENKGFTFIEVIGNCSIDANSENNQPIFPLGIFKNKFETKA